MCGEMPAWRSTSTSASTTGVLPAPPTTRLPTQITGTGARYGWARARCTRLAASIAAPTGARSPARRLAPGPGASSQNSGVRIGRFPGRDGIEPGFEALHHRIGRAGPAGGDAGGALGAPGAQRRIVEQPRHRGCESLLVGDDFRCLRAYQRVDHRRTIGGVRAEQDGAIEPRCFEWVVSTDFDQR